MCGLQPMVFDESEASLCHFVVLVVTWVLGLILVPICLGLAGIGSSSPLQVSTSLLRRFCMEGVRGCFEKISVVEVEVRSFVRGVMEQISVGGGVLRELS